MTAAAMIEKYGADIRVTGTGNAGARTGKGLISPLSYPGTMNAPKSTRAGMVNRAKYLLITGPEMLSGEENGTVVSCGGRNYQLLRCEVMEIGGAVSHWEGVMLLKGGDKDA